MEGDFDFMNFNFNQEMNVYEELPFGNWSEQSNHKNSQENFFNFLKINYNSSPEVEKKDLQGEEIIEKITEFEKSYTDIIHKSIIASPTQNLNDKIKGNLDSNLILAEGTLPGLLISIMFQENEPVTQNFLLEKIGSKFDTLRKLNGSKYRGDINKVLKSTLCSSGLFITTEERKFYFKEKEALNYIIKVTEKVLTKKLEKNKKESKNSQMPKSTANSKSTSSVSNNFKSTLSLSSNISYNIDYNNPTGNCFSSYKNANHKILGNNNKNENINLKNFSSNNKLFNSNVFNCNNYPKCPLIHQKKNGNLKSLKSIKKKNESKKNLKTLILDCTELEKNSQIKNFSFIDDKNGQSPYSNFNDSSNDQFLNGLNNNKEFSDNNNTICSENKKKRKKNLSFTKRIDYKICKVYNILDDLLVECRNNDFTKNFDNSFKDINSSLELLQKIGDQNKVIGILMCFKYFKSIINKYTKLSHKKKHKESLLDINKLNNKLEILRGKISVIEQKLSEKTDMQIDEYL